MSSVWASSRELDAGWQNSFRSHFYADPDAHSAYLVDCKADAMGAAQNTQGFDFQLRDVIIDRFLNTGE